MLQYMRKHGMKRIGVSLVVLIFLMSFFVFIQPAHSAIERVERQSTSPPWGAEWGTGEFSVGPYSILLPFSYAVLYASDTSQLVLVFFSTSPLTQTDVTPPWFEIAIQDATVLSTGTPTTIQSVGGEVAEGKNFACVDCEVVFSRLELRNEGVLSGSIGGNGVLVDEQTLSTSPYPLSGSFENLPVLDIREGPPVIDGDEDDDTSQQANVVVLNGPPQQHNFSQPGDEDWFKLYGIAGEKYTVSLTQLGSRIDPIIEVFASDGVTLLASNQTNPKTRSSESPAEVTVHIQDIGAGVDFEYTPTTDDVFFVEVRNKDPNVYGDGTEYSFQISRAVSITSTVEGVVSDAALGNPLGEVRIKTSANCSALTLPTGDYLMPHPSGTFTLTAEASGYETYTDTITILEAETMIKDISMTPSSSDSSCQLGGISAGSSVTGNIDTSHCSTFTLLLSQQPSTNIRGRLYISIEVPSISELAQYMWYRPADSMTPPYIQIVRDETGLQTRAGDYYYFEGLLGGQDLLFDIGGTNGLKGLTIVFGTWYLEEGLPFNETNLKSIQRIQVTFR